jgi:uncharacterized membrane protein YeaQ/YmgE (transglycosylase-associated protein family)
MELLDEGCTGATLAVVLRWLLHLDVGVHWAACVGAAGSLLGPWLQMQFGPMVAAYSFFDVVGGAVVAMALLGIAQVLRTY